MHCLILWSGAATVHPWWQDKSSGYVTRRVSRMYTITQKLNCEVLYTNTLNRKLLRLPKSHTTSIVFQYKDSLRSLSTASIQALA